MRHTKIASLEETEHQLAVYAQVASNFKPKGIQREPDGYSYEWVVGTHNRRWEDVWVLARAAFWSGVEKKLINRIDYVDYVMSLVEDAGLVLDKIHNALRPILIDPLTPVRLCHGDCTFANVIGGTFIDPGHDRGLPCRELDESKMMQSLDGFDEIFREWEPEASVIFPARRVHFALLLSHYVRMLRHVNQKGQEYAYKRIGDIANTSDLYPRYMWMHL